MISTLDNITFESYGSYYRLKIGDTIIDMDDKDVFKLYRLLSMFYTSVNIK